MIDNHSLAITSDKKVLSNGNDNYGQVSGTSTWTNVIQVAGGKFHSAGLLEDGTVVICGRDLLDATTTIQSWTNVKQITCSSYWVFGLLEDGTIVKAPLDFEDQFGEINWTNVKQISAGGSHLIGLLKDETVVGTGSNGDGQLNNLSTWSNVKQVECGSWHTLALLNDGTVVGSGYDEYNQVSDTSTWTNVKQISGGSFHSAGLLENNTIKTCGADWGIDKIEVESWQNIIQVSLGTQHILALDDNGKVLSNGNDNYGQVSGTSTWGNIEEIFGIDKIEVDWVSLFEQRIRKITLNQWIKWDGVNQENVTNYIKSFTIDQKLEGYEGVSVVDQATVTTLNHDNYFSPKMENSYANLQRETQINAGVNDNIINIFDGIIQGIKPTYDNRRCSITIKDKLDILKGADCPNKFYYKKFAHDLIKEWLDKENINYSPDTIDDTALKINYNFNGMKKLDALQMIADACQCVMYMSNNLFHFKKDINTFAEEYMPEPVYTITEDNMWSISEEYTTQDIYNKVQVKSEPLVEQNEQIVWTGSKGDNKVEEELIWNSGNDTNRQIQLNPDNTPLVQSQTNVAVFNTSQADVDGNEVLYSVQNGRIEVDYNTGLITFPETYPDPNDPTVELTNELPRIDDILKIEYNYLVYTVSSNSQRTILVNLDNPSVDLKNINLQIVYLNENNEEIEITDININNVDDIDNTYSSSNNTAFDVHVEQIINASKMRVQLVFYNNTSNQIILKGKYQGNIYDNNLLLIGKPYMKTRNFYFTYTDEDSVNAYKIKREKSTQNDLINTEKVIKTKGKALSKKYSTPFSKLKAEYKGLGFLELHDIVKVEQTGRMESEKIFEITGIKHKFEDSESKGVWKTDYELRQAVPSNFIYDENNVSFLATNEKLGDNPYAINPPNIENFDGILNNDNIMLKWNPVRMKNITYEIRVGDSWNTGVILTDETKTSYYNISSLPDGEWKFWIKAINEVGNYSETATFTTIDIFELQDKNTVEIFEDDYTNGTHNNTLKYPEGLATYSDGSDPDYNFLPCELKGTYTSPIFDLYTNNLNHYQKTAKKVKCYLDYELFLRGKDSEWEDIFTPDMTWEHLFDYDKKRTWLDLFESGSIKIKLKYSQDKVSWKTVENFVLANIKARYFQVVIEFNNLDQWNQLLLKPYKLIIDTPDIIERGRIIVQNVTNGTIRNVKLNKDFYEIQNIDITIEDAETSYAITNFDVDMSSDNFDIVLYRDTPADVIINYTVTGK